MASYLTQSKQHESEHLEMPCKDDLESPDSDKAAEPVSTNDYVPDTEEEKKLVRKIDMYLLPMIFLMYLWSYMDRTK